MDALSAHVAAFGAGEDDVILPHGGRTIGPAMVSKHMRTAAAASGVPGSGWHDPRHHHASTLLAAGVNPAKVAERLGHDPKTLLTTCAHVMPRDDDRVRAIVDESLAGSAEDWLRTEAG